ncbi:hypothetical protein FIBSPDRAFT_1008499 [Athelia psychrophila]|uniref:Uncharacterized protein n=1 Tax=Athelia psychrophila TaxID=1759441 RepID=A0A167V7I1_9AGAM|nr:hypothetical protein FIBSPDRAFT_1008499 [Fibularhizoctonia sp. CBS 109695]
MSDWRRRWLKDVSRFPIQAVVSDHVESLSLHESLSNESLFWMGEWGPLGDDAEIKAAMAYLRRLGAREHRYDTDSDMTEVDSLSSSEVDSFTTSETCSSVRFTDSIEDLVGTEWLLHERWASEIY